MVKNFVLLFFFISLVAGCSNAPVYGPLAITKGGDLPRATHEISISTWNVGYGALGSGADFIADGGRSLRALPRPAIEVASRAIAAQITTLGAQFLFLQELADANFLTRHVPLLSRIDAALPEYSEQYWPDVELTNVPAFLRISHGMGVYAKKSIKISHVYALPSESGTLALGVKRYYAAIVNEVPIAGSRHKWVLINIHMAAFDPQGRVRRKQIAAVLELAIREYRAGSYVIIGGDWNMRLVPTDFPHTTRPKYLTWVIDFPQKYIPDGWHIGADAGVPTVRTLQKAYVAGENYTTIVDGFLYSPNVRKVSVVTRDLGFRYSDHQPATGVFRAK